MRLLPGVRNPSDRGRGALTPGARATVAGLLHRSGRRCPRRRGRLALTGCAVAHPPRTTGQPAQRATSRPAPRDLTAAKPRPAASPEAAGGGGRGCHPRLVRGAEGSAEALRRPVRRTRACSSRPPRYQTRPTWWTRPSGGSRRARRRACSPGRPGTCRTGSRPRAGTGTGLGRGFATTWYQMFSLPDVPGVLDSRELVVEVVQDGDKTAIRVDAQVAWQPARPASEKVPAAAKAVTISMDLGLNQGGKKPPKPVTITDPAKVRALTALINGLALFPPGAFSCPADFGDDLVLTFRAGPRSPGPRRRHRRPRRLRRRGSHHRRQVPAGPGGPGHRQRPPDPEDGRPVLENPRRLRPARAGG